MIGGVAGGLGNEAMRGESMSIGRRKILLNTIFLIWLLGLIATTSIACERPAPIRVVNQTDQTLTIFITKQKIGEVGPGAEISNQNSLVPAGGIKEYLIEAKNAQGNSVYSRSFTFDQLSRDMNWRVVIPPQ